MDRNYKGRFWYSKEVFLMVKAVWKWNRVIYYRRDWLRNNMADQPLGHPFELGFLKNDFNKMTTCRDMCRTGGAKKCDAPVVVAQFLSVVWLFATSRTARLPCPSPSPSGEMLKHAQIHVYWVVDAIQPSHPLSSPSPLAFNLSQHQGLFQRVGSSNQPEYCS